MRTKAAQRHSALVRRLLAWARTNGRPFPWRQEPDTFRILVAEVLLQRSRGRTVANVYRRLFDRWSTPEALGAASTDEIEDVIRPLGLVRRAHHLKALARCIADRGAVPRRYEELVALPGVGRYAANATLVAAFNEPVPVVDGVTARVYRRYLGLPDGIPPVDDDELWQVVSDVMPRTRAREWNWAVLDLAAAVCMPKVPRCGVCPLAASCAYARSGVSTCC